MVGRFRLAGRAAAAAALVAADGHIRDAFLVTTYAAGGPAYVLPLGGLLMTWDARGRRGASAARPTHVTGATLDRR